MVAESMGPEEILNKGLILDMGEMERRVTQVHAEEVEAHGFAADAAEVMKGACDLPSQII